LHNVKTADMTVKPSIGRTNLYVTEDPEVWVGIGPVDVRLGIVAAMVELTQVHDSSVNVEEGTETTPVQLSMPVETGAMLFGVCDVPK
jgi:hypothetical protein